VNATLTPRLMVGSLLLFTIRGLLLWVLVPLTTVAYLLIGVAWRSYGVTLARTLGWVDLNLIATIQRIVLRPFFRNRTEWVSIRKIPNVTHRIRFADPA
jgi:hypothetical protein